MMDEKNLIPENTTVVWFVLVANRIFLNYHPIPKEMTYRSSISMVHSCYPKEKHQKLDNSILNNNHQHP